MKLKYKPWFGSFQLNLIEQTDSSTFIYSKQLDKKEYIHSNDHSLQTTNKNTQPECIAINRGENAFSQPIQSGFRKTLWIWIAGLALLLLIAIWLLLKDERS